MIGFIGWMRAEPAFEDLSEDSKGVGSFKALIKDMRSHQACEAAWASLIAAVYYWPGDLPEGWTREIFDGSLDTSEVIEVLIRYACPLSIECTDITKEQFDDAYRAVQALKEMGDPLDQVEDIIEQVACTSLQRCLLLRIMCY